jgi:hypothetical protein
MLLREPGAEIEARQELAVVRNIVRHLGRQPGIGLVAGSRYQLTAYGIWGYAFLASRTLRSAIEIGIRYLDLTFVFTRFCAETRKIEGTMRVLHFALPPVCPARLPARRPSGTTGSRLSLTDMV